MTKTTYRVIYNSRFVESNSPMRSCSSSSFVISWHNDVRMQGRPVVFSTLRHPHMVRRSRLLMTASSGEDWPALKRKTIREVEMNSMCLQTLPEQEKARIPKQYVPLMMTSYDSEVDLSGGFPLPADTLESCWKCVWEEKTSKQQQLLNVLALSGVDLKQILIKLEEKSFQVESQL